MIMLISFGRDCSLTQTRMAVGRITFDSKGPMMGQYVFLTAKSHNFIQTLYFNYYLWRHSLLFPPNYFNSVHLKYPGSNKNRAE